MLVQDIEQTLVGDEILKEKGYQNEVLADMSGVRLEFLDIKFEKCRFENCDFSGSAYYDTKFSQCDFSNCKFRDCYFKNTEFQDCKGDGSDFCRGTFVMATIEKGSYHYVNCGDTSWDSCRLSECDFHDSFFSEVKFKRTTFANVDFSKVDFFKTILKGVDLSDCTIDGITVSDTLNELKGVKINAMQAIEVVRLLGIKLV